MIKFGRWIPITIHPIFWLTAAVIGLVNSMYVSFGGIVYGTLIWMFVILISLLVHEMGHALTSKAFGQSAQIELVAMGGLTYHSGKKLKLWQDFIVVLMGPVFGLSLCGLAYLVKSNLVLTHLPLISFTLTIFVWVNLFWTIINLLPILPLDGGQLLRIILEGIFGHKGLKISLMIGIVIGVSLGIVLFTVGYYLLGAILLLLSFESFSSWRQVKMMTPQDRDESVQKGLEEAQRQLSIGNVQDAISKLEKLREGSKRGLIFNAATEQLAFIFAKQNDYNHVYELLKTIQSHLSPNGRRLLHRASYYVGDYELTLTIGNDVFRQSQDYQIATFNAQAAAQLKDIKATIGWLESALNHGLPNLNEVTSNKVFDALKENNEFKKFLDSH